MGLYRFSVMVFLGSKKFCNSSYFITLSNKSVVDKKASDKLQWMAITQIESVNNYSTAVIHIVGEQASRRVSKGALVVVCVAITWLWQPPLPLTQNYCAPQLHEDHHHHHEAFKTWFIASIQSEQVSTGQRKCEKISDEFD